MADLYWPCVQAAFGTLQALPDLAGVSLKLRPYVMLVTGDTLPLLVLAPRTDEWETESDQTFEDGILLGYPVIAGLVVENTADQAQVQQQLTLRAAIRQALYTSAILWPTVPAGFEVHYNPRPAGLKLKGFTDAQAVSLQEFRYTTSEVRATIP